MYFEQQFVIVSTDAHNLVPYHRALDGALRNPSTPSTCRGRGTTDLRLSGTSSEDGILVTASNAFTVPPVPLWCTLGVQIQGQEAVDDLVTSRIIFWVLVPITISNSSIGHSACIIFHIITESIIVETSYSH
ncbi:hypothetical protein GWI33_005423 [Rhynchophorus ferrugineus]|uniref:Uncharacterized protein n=1 Tax=Rhynchophorus ferrugineus TaxID=354439 RepID=A0A834MJL8_RHYFE|nr:hypothetical protein GWI33_005423 [Rhynchophorus ferrugineus]